VIHGILGTKGNRDPVLHFSEMLTDDALAYMSPETVDVPTRR